ncbi:polyprenyl synthetase family protein [Saccharothrix variisporea]|uniref:Heptaprenyl diphosphate synthase n=1 Tax=Saccharothrix variisporea TaxID=543527 RepID=A0A495XHL4_9PSEU|nr:heptaprenyl diphosphate synthase [Saccharothrix variisporea]
MTSSERAGTGFRFADPVLAEVVQAGLTEVEELLRKVVQSEFHPVMETSLHLVDAGGKRIRPLFTILSAQFGSTWDREAVIKAAAVVELTHLATLYHDDVMDEATMRRGAASANAKWDNSIAILTGDYLFAHASALVADLGTRAARIIAETFSELVTGQMRETMGPREGENPIAHYLTTIAEKTGSLIATAARYGAMFSDVTPAQVEALRTYGEIIGAAFQISDDVIDIASPSSESGKTPGTDLREGVKTLPMLYALADEPESRLASLLAQPLTDDAEVEEALELLRASSGLARARATLDDYANRARATLKDLPAGVARDALESVSEYVVTRTH